MTSQPRDHAVGCIRCRRMTWNISAICDLHTKLPKVPDEHPERRNSGPMIYRDPLTTGEDSHGQGS